MRGSFRAYGLSAPVPWFAVNKHVWPQQIQQNNAINQQSIVTKFIKHGNFPILISGRYSENEYANILLCYYQKNIIRYSFSDNYRYSTIITDTTRLKFRLCIIFSPLLCVIMLIKKKKKIFLNGNTKFANVLLQKKENWLIKKQENDILSLPINIQIIRRILQFNRATDFWLKISIAAPTFQSTIKNKPNNQQTRLLLNFPRFHHFGVCQGTH